MDDPIIKYEGAQDVTELQESPPPPGQRAYHCFARVNGELFVQQTIFTVEVIRSQEFSKVCEQITTRSALRHWRERLAKS